jgi:hypothetical protein
LHRGIKNLLQEGAQSKTGGMNQTRRRRSSAIDQTWAYMEIDYVAMPPFDHTIPPWPDTLCFGLLEILHHEKYSEIVAGRLHGLVLSNIIKEGQNMKICYCNFFNPKRSYLRVFNQPNGNQTPEELGANHKMYIYQNSFKIVSHLN